MSQSTFDKDYVRGGVIFFFLKANGFYEPKFTPKNYWKEIYYVERNFLGTPLVKCTAKVSVLPFIRVMSVGA